MKRVPSKEFLEKAKTLSREEAEQLLARMKGKLSRRVEDQHTDPLNAVAIQLEIEDEKLQEWRTRWAEISAGEEKKKKK